MLDARASTDPVRAALKVAVYVLFYLLSAIILAPPLLWIGGNLAGAALSSLLGATLANLLALRIYERRNLADIGFWWNSAARRNLALGLAGGIGGASLALCLPLAAGIARLHAIRGESTSWGSLLFVLIVLLLGSIGEEMLFRGYGFQILLGAAGPWATILPVGILFGAMHSWNPGASKLGLINTAGFGILFGYAFLRSGDLWLPVGMHFGWNLTLPLFGVNVSGFTMKLTGHVMEWSLGPLWSGGEYGPEAGLPASAVLLVMFFYLRKAPVRPQKSVLAASPVEI